MKVLLDTCVWGGIKEKLVTAGYDVIWAGEWTEDPGDEEILDRAHGEGRVLVTLDKDFEELAVAQGRPHCGIVRLVDLSAQTQARACLSVLKRYGNELGKGAIVTADPDRIRIRL